MAIEGIERERHRDRIRQADSIFAGLDFERMSRVTVALDGKLCARGIEGEDACDVLVV